MKKKEEVGSRFPIDIIFDEIEISKLDNWLAEVKELGATEIQFDVDYSEENNISMVAYSVREPTEQEQKEWDEMIKSTPREVFIKYQPRKTE